MSKVRLSLLVAALGAAGVVSACSASPASEGSSNRLEQQPAFAFMERKSGRIVYIGTDGNIYVADQAGGNQVALTTDAQLTEDFYHVYRAPAWSPDGSQVAFVEDSGRPGALGAASSSLLTVSREGGVLEEAVNSSETTLYYVHWSADGDWLSYLGSNLVSGSSELGVVPTDGSGHSEALGSGNPLYVAWSPDGRSVLLHSDAERAGGTLSRMALDDAGSGSGVALPLPYEPAAFQAPAWSPDGSLTLFAVEGEGNASDRLVVADAEGRSPRVLDEFSGKVAFGWSPDGRYVATLTSVTAGAGDGPSLGVLGDLHVFDLEQDREVEIDEDDFVMAFYWSPNSRRLVYFVPGLFTDEETGEQVVVLDMKIAQVRTGETHSLLQFQPTEEFLRVLHFFDQYQNSTTLWSPDNQYVTFALLTQNGPIVAVMHVSGAVDPRGIGEGIVSSWSWE